MAEVRRLRPAAHRSRPSAGSGPISGASSARARRGGLNRRCRTGDRGPPPPGL